MFAWEREGDGVRENVCEREKRDRELERERESVRERKREREITCSHEKWKVWSK